MPALSFQKEFALAVERGSKTQSIRALRKRPIHKGDWLALYTGMRTSRCRKLGEARVTSVVQIEIFPTHVALGGDRILLSETGLTQSTRFARRDGFASLPHLVIWFRETHGLPFVGEVIRWRLLRRRDWR